MKKFNNKFSAVERPGFLRRVPTCQKLPIPCTISSDSDEDEDYDVDSAQETTYSSRQPAYLLGLVPEARPNRPQLQSSGVALQPSAVEFGIEILNRDSSRASGMPARAEVADQVVVERLQSLKNLTLINPDEDSDLEDDLESSGRHAAEDSFSLGSCSIIEQYFSGQEDAFGSSKYSKHSNGGALSLSSLYANARSGSSSGGSGSGSSASLASTNSSDSSDFRSPVLPWDTTAAADARRASDPIAIPAAKVKAGRRRACGRSVLGPMAMGACSPPRPLLETASFARRAKRSIKAVEPVAASLLGSSLCPRDDDDIFDMELDL